jgi:GntR family transcriptional regulator
MAASTTPGAARPAARTAGRTARHLQIEEHLRGLVARGRPGDALPTEAELCETFQVSRMTARQALTRLVSEGLIQRRRGQGTFVAAQQLHRGPGVLLSFSEEIRRRGMRPSSRVITATMEVAGPDEIRDLGLAPGTEIVRIVRVRRADDVPVAVENAALVPDLRGVLDVDLADGSLHEAVAGLGVQPGWQSGWVGARLARPGEHRLLALRPVAAILVEVGVAYDADGRAFERTETAYAAERYAIDTVHVRPAPLLPGQEH